MGRNRGKHLTGIERPLLDLVSGRLTYHPQPDHPDENTSCCMHLPRANWHDGPFLLRSFEPVLPSSRLFGQNFDAVASSDIFNESIISPSAFSTPLLSMDSLGCPARHVPLRPVVLAGGHKSPHLRGRPISRPPSRSR